MDITTGDIVPDYAPRIERSVIRSCAKWNYQLAEDILTGKVTSEDQLAQQYKPEGHEFLDMCSDLL